MTVNPDKGTSSTLTVLKAPGELCKNNPCQANPVSHVLGLRRGLGISSFQNASQVISGLVRVRINDVHDEKRQTPNKSNSGLRLSSWDVSMADLN